MSLNLFYSILEFVVVLVSRHPTKMATNRVTSATKTFIRFFLEACAKSDLTYPRIDSHSFVSTVATMSNTIAEKELEIHTSIHYGSQLAEDAFPSNDDPKCQVTVDINPKIICDEIQIIFSVKLPLMASPASQFHSKLQDRLIVNSVITYPGEHYFIDTITSLTLEIVITYMTNNGIPRVLTRSLNLPLKLVANVCAPIKEAAVKITLNTTEPVIALPQLYPGKWFTGSTGLYIHTGIFIFGLYIHTSLYYKQVFIQVCVI